jgi:hypothetical protein
VSRAIPYSTDFCPAVKVAAPAGAATTRTAAATAAAINPRTFIGA